MKIEEGEGFFQEALLSSDPESWEFLLSRVMLEEVKKERRKGFTTEDQWREHAERVERFEASALETMQSKRKSLESLAPLWARLADGTISLEEKQGILKKALEYDPENRMVPGALAYYSAALEAWPEARELLKKFLEKEGRPNALWLRLQLLEAQILHYQGLEAQAEAELNEACRRIRDPWFLALCGYLQGRRTEESLRKEPKDRPEDMVTGYTALGFWAEGSKDKSMALRFYREALNSFLTDWLEYDFARERIKRLKKAGP
jgi:tetratricopeptide (TPR) repeat protein